jgi:predicted restriction endonuclease
MRHTKNTMANYDKKSQTKKEVRERKTCVDCGRNRLIKFFSKETAIKCNDCKRKTKRLRKKKTGRKSNLKDELDNLWSAKVKELADYKCEYCGKEEYLNSHHIFSRSNHSVRWELENGVCLCSGHHTLISKFSAHKTPMEFTEWIMETRGEKWYNKLKEKAHEPINLNLEYMEKVKEKLED